MSIINSISAQDGLKTIEEVVKGSNKPFNYRSFQLLVLLLTICIGKLSLDIFDRTDCYFSEELAEFSVRRAVDSIF